MPGARLVPHTWPQEWQTGAEMQTAGLRLGQGQSLPATPGSVGRGGPGTPAVQVAEVLARGLGRVCMHSAASPRTDTGQLSRHGTQVSHWAHFHVQKPTIRVHLSPEYGKLSCAMSH